MVLSPESAELCPVAALISPDPHPLFARIATLLHPAPMAVPGVHASAVVDPAARIDPSAQISAHCVVGTGAVIGARCRIGPACIIGPDVIIGEDTHLTARVTLQRGVQLGRRVLIHPGAVIGADGFGFAREHGHWLKVPQIGSVRIGDDVEIGANTTVDRGAMQDTVIGEGVKLDNLIRSGTTSRSAHTRQSPVAPASAAAHVLALVA